MSRAAGTGALLERLPRGDLGARLRPPPVHRAKLAAYPGPVLVTHALHDDLVPATHGRRLADWAASAVILKLFERGDHDSILAANAGATRPP